MRLLRISKYKGKIIYLNLSKLDSIEINNTHITLTFDKIPYVLMLRNIQDNFDAIMHNLTKTDDKVVEIYYYE